VAARSGAARAKVAPCACVPGCVGGNARRVFGEKPQRLGRDVNAASRPCRGVAAHGDAVAGAWRGTAWGTAWSSDGGCGVQRQGDGFLHEKAARRPDGRSPRVGYRGFIGGARHHAGSRGGGRERAAAALTGGSLARRCDAVAGRRRWVEAVQDAQLHRRRRSSAGLVKLRRRCPPPPRTPLLLHFLPLLLFSCGGGGKEGRGC
jgi:hypothetical protein